MEGLREVTIFIAGLRESFESFLYGALVVLVFTISHNLSGFFNHLLGLQRVLTMILTGRFFSHGSLFIFTCLLAHL